MRKEFSLENKGLNQWQVIHSGHVIGSVWVNNIQVTATNHLVATSWTAVPVNPSLPNYSEVFSLLDDALNYLLDTAFDKVNSLREYNKETVFNCLRANLDIVYALIHKLLKSNSKIEAIKFARAFFNIDLKSAKEFVESLEEPIDKS